MTAFDLKNWQLILTTLLYIAYLCWVMFGGMKRKKIKLTLYIVMTVLMFYGLIKEYNGIQSIAAAVNIIIVLFIGFVKGIYLGHRKIVEKIDGIWYLHHNGKYIVAWILFFTVKLICTSVLKIVSGTEIPLWHMILYFCFYYPWRTANVFIANPEMKQEVLGSCKLAKRI